MSIDALADMLGLKCERCYRRRNDGYCEIKNHLVEKDDKACFYFVIGTVEFGGK